MTSSSTLLADTHCHLMMPAFDEDRSDAIARAWKRGVRWIVVPGLDIESSQKAIHLADDYPSVYAAVGLHPHNARKWTEASDGQIRELAEQPNVVAIGEIGLDYYRDFAPRDLQRRVFKQQLDIARDLNLPVIIHNRNAIDHIIEMLLQRSNGGDGLPKGRAGVLHAFSADLEMACRAIDLGFFIGVAGPITFKNAGRLRELVAELPLSTLLVETDSPYLTPDPYRGKRNEPAYVTMVAEHLSQSIGSDYHQTSHVTSENAAELFGWHYGKDDRNIH